MEPESGPDSGRWIWGGLAALAVSGALLAVWPHLDSWARTGDPGYVADSDGLLYLAWSRDVVRRGSLSLTDAVHRQSGRLMHPTLLFVPPALLAHALGVGMTGLGVIWRVLAGAGIALGLYAAVRPSVRDPRVALGVSALLLFDPGLLIGQLVQSELEILASLARGSRHFFDGMPRIMPHLRVVTPALAVPVLLGHLGLALRARASGRIVPAIAASASFGLLFYVYFYFWTAVLVGAALAFVFDPRGRRLFAIIVVGGLVLGLPALISGSVVKATTPPDWLLRTDKFVPIGHFRELLLPRVLVVEWLIAAVVIFRRRRELTYLWCLTGGGLFCVNHQLVTGLQIENFHWLQAVGISFSVLVAALLAPWLFERPAGPAPRGGTIRGAWLVALVAVQVAIGLFLREAEANRTRETRAWARLSRELAGDLPALPQGAVVAGDRDATFLKAALGEVYPLSGRLVDFSARATDPELDERLILNLYLEGTPHADALRLVGRKAGTLSWEAAAVRSSTLEARQRARRNGLIAAIWKDPLPWLKRYDVAFVVLPAGADTGHLVPLGHRVREGRHWQTWRIDRIVSIR